LCPTYLIFFIAFGNINKQNRIIQQRDRMVMWIPTFFSNCGKCIPKPTKSWLNCLEKCKYKWQGFELCFLFYKMWNRQFFSFNFVWNRNFLSVSKFFGLWVSILALFQKIWHITHHTCSILSKLCKRNVTSPQFKQLCRIRFQFVGFLEETVKRNQSLSSKCWLWSF